MHLWKRKENPPLITVLVRSWHKPSRYVSCLVIRKSGLVSSWIGELSYQSGQPLTILNHLTYDYQHIRPNILWFLLLLASLPKEYLASQRWHGPNCDICRPEVWWIHHQHQPLVRHLFLYANTSATFGRAASVKSESFRLRISILFYSQSRRARGLGLALVTEGKLWYHQSRNENTESSRSTDRRWCQRDIQVSSIIVCWPSSRSHQETWGQDWWDK